MDISITDALQPVVFFHERKSLLYNMFPKNTCTKKCTCFTRSYIVSRKVHCSMYLCHLSALEFKGLGHVLS